METNELCSDLLKRINYMRQILISVGLSKGMNDNETLKYSEELDKLILYFQKCCYEMKHFATQG